MPVIDRRQLIASNLALGVATPHFAIAQSAPYPNRKIAVATSCLLRRWCIGPITGLFTLPSTRASMAR